MIITKKLAKYVVFTDDTLAHSLQKISDNKSGLVFVLAQSGVLEGILTDGDFRRWLLSTENMDLSLPTEMAFNKTFLAIAENTPTEEINAQLSERVKYIPLIDRQGRLVSIASSKQSNIQIGDFTIADDHPAFIIAEIGNNHNGSLDLAKKLVDEIILSGADCAKFQMRDMASMYRQDDVGDASEDLGAQYTLDLLSRFQLSNEELFEAFDYCKEKGILPLCTPWDQNSLDALEIYGMPAYKLASADLTNLDLLEVMSKTQKPLICSTGMSSESEIIEAVDVLKKNAAQFVLLHCNSTYPAPFKDINLKYLTRLKKIGGGCPVGYSGHERGYAIPIGAVAKGARVIEKHFTLDRNMEGNDHRVSLLPQEFTEMVQHIRDLEQALGGEESRKVSQGEMMNREVLGKSVLATRSLKLGEIICEVDLEIRSPGKGLAPYRKKELVGRVASRDMQKGDFFYPSDVAENVVLPRSYKFDRPFGIPVRYHDVASMISKSNFDLLEFHLSYKDMELDPAKYLRAEGYDMDLVVHSPELFAADHVMDLCSDDAEYRAESISELQRVVDVTLNLQKYFHRSECPQIIINAGGFTSDDFMPKHERKDKYALIKEALQQINSDGVEIIPQTMPPYPWHFGGQRFHNLFMDHDEIVEFCKENKMRICFDISHSKLACTLAKKSFSNFVEDVAPYVAHLHIVDAEGVDGEGLQIGDGEIDFASLADILRDKCPNATFIPEIWQGHKNDGEGFWIALERLEVDF